MKVILLENLKKIGSIGEVIEVKRGFARNFLIANKKALYASKENISEVEKIKAELSKKDNERYMAIATSGDYRNFFTFENKRYSHTLDPKSGFPISNNISSVSVALPGQFRHTGDADALATSLNVMGLDKGYDFAVKNSIAALFIFKSENQFSVKMTPSFKNIIN